MDKKVALGFGLSAAKVESAVAIATTLAPFLAMIIYFIVNQIAAMGKAKAVIDKIEAVTASSSTIVTEPSGKTTETQTVTPPTMAEIKSAETVQTNPIGWNATKAAEDAKNPPLPVSVTSLVKDRVAMRVQLASTDEGMWDVLFGKFDQRMKAEVEHFAQLNPNLGGVEAAQKVVDDMYKVRLDAKQCSVIQSMIGLPAAIFAKTDTFILAQIKASIEKSEADAKASGTPAALAYQRENWRRIAIDNAKEMTINEAADRVKNANLPIKYRELALQEFGMSPEDAHKTQWAGGSAKIYYVIPGGVGGTYMDFADGAMLLGMTR